MIVRCHYPKAQRAASSEPAPTIDLVTNSDQLQHDAVLDYYGRRLATCSSDRTIKIFEVEGETHRLTETLKG